MDHYFLMLIIGVIVNWVHPLFLKDHGEDSNEDNPNWNQAMNGPFADE